MKVNIISEYFIKIAAAVYLYLVGLYLYLFRR